MSCCLADAAPSLTHTTLCGRPAHARGDAYAAAPHPHPGGALTRADTPPLRPCAACTLTSVTRGAKAPRDHTLLTYTPHAPLFTLGTVTDRSLTHEGDGQHTTRGDTHDTSRIRPTYRRTPCNGHVTDTTYRGTNTLSVRYNTTKPNVACVVLEIKGRAGGISNGTFPSVARSTHEGRSTATIDGSMAGPSVLTACNLVNVSPHCRME